jgi:type III restriction enzyme
MKIKFDPTLEYQQQAVSAVVDVFEGQGIAQSQFTLEGSEAILFTELGIGNNITLPEEQLEANVQKIQETNGIQKITHLQGREFSIEMETGTGKTYVYLRTIFELSKNYGLKKFIIVVPSIAVREGVLKSLEMTTDHFSNLYDKPPFESFVYDGKKPHKVRQFATSNQIQIMVINIQAFVRDVPEKEPAEMTEEEKKKIAIIHRENDRMSGRKPIEFIQTTNPIVIIDEPQSVDNTPKARKAIATLNPAVTLRYSATHKAAHNLLYKLDPIRAYDLRLVKRIEVASVVSDENFNDAYVKLLKTDNSKGIKAQLEIHKDVKGTVKTTKVWVKQGDDLFIKSGDRENYREGYIVRTIDCTPNSERLEFNNRKFLEIGTEMGGLGHDIMREQVRETVERHLAKERSLLGRKIKVKVLSLFFIDKVANYRIYNDDGTRSLGKLGQWFEEAYQEFTAKDIYKDFAVTDLTKAHDGYFSQDKQKKHDKDTTGKTADDEDTYSLIMREKEKLLDPSNPLRFIFTHSALREGWDNPNVFQICTLNESQSIDKKRQEIGRGLRLPVNEHGDRIHDENINRLTIIANESYDEFANKLQQEFEEDLGIKFGHIEKISFAQILRPAPDGETKPIGQEESAAIWERLYKAEYIDEQGQIQPKFEPNNPHFELKIGAEYTDITVHVIDKLQEYIFKNRVVDARKRERVGFKKEVYVSKDFLELWEKIKHRTRYRVMFDTEILIEQAVKRVKNMQPIQAARIAVTRVDIDINQAGVVAEKQLEYNYRDASSLHKLPDLLAYLQKATELTRHTLAHILQKSGRLANFLVNPQAFMSLSAREISRALHDLMLEGLQYEKVANQYWEMSRIEKDAEQDIMRYLNNLYKVKNTKKYLFDAVEYESEVEKEFARDLDNNEHVKLFIKLPKWFKIDTPIGSYNPDWAFVTEREQKLFFVRETKSTFDSEERRKQENQKIECGKRHFETIGVHFDVVTKLSEVRF